MRSQLLTWVVRGASFAIGVGLVAIVAFVALSALPVVLLAFLAILLGAGLEPVVGWLRSRLPIGRAISILVVYALFLTLVVVLGVIIVPAAAVQMELALNRLPTFLESIRTATSGLQPDVLAKGVGGLVDAAEQALRPAPPDTGTVVGASVAVASVVAAVVTLLTLVFFWLTERPRLQRYALAFVPRTRRPGVRDGWNEVETRLGLWVRGQLILMGTLGVLTGIAYSLLGLPAALLLALIAAIAEIVPIAGPLIGAIPALLVATTVSTETAILTLGVYVAIQFIEGNVLVPMVMRNTIGLSPFLVAISILTGFTAGGPLGAIVAVPIVAAIEAILERLQARRIPVPLDPAAAGTPAEREDLEERPPGAPELKRRRRPPAGSRAGPRRDRGARAT